MHCLPQWTTYYTPLIGITKSKDLDRTWLFLLLLAVLAVVRKAFLRHVLRDRLRQQYESLFLKIMKAKSMIYRLTVAAYGLPAPDYDQLPAQRT